MAFDKVPHERLLYKLEKFDITGKLRLWIRSWLCKRFQHVCLEGVTSEWVEVLSGVPQGSVLGPILFLLYINDLDESVKISLLKFADDTKILSEDDNIQLQLDLDTLLKW